MPRRFNTAGPCRPDWHDMIPAERRLPEAPGLVDNAVFRDADLEGLHSTARTFEALS